MFCLGIEGLGLWEYGAFVNYLGFVYVVCHSQLSSEDDSEDGEGDRCSQSQIRIEQHCQDHSHHPHHLNKQTTDRIIYSDLSFLPHSFSHYSLPLALSPILFIYRSIFSVLHKLCFLLLVLSHHIHFIGPPERTDVSKLLHHALQVYVDYSSQHCLKKPAHTWTICLDIFLCNWTH